MRRAVLTMVVALLAAPVSADDLYKACIDKTDTNYGWVDCGAAYLTRADEALDAEWTRTYALAKGRTKVDLLAEQRAWLAYKEASCAFYHNGEWGREGEVLHVFGCRGDVIERRTADLAAIRAFIAQ